MEISKPQEYLQLLRVCFPQFYVYAVCTLPLVYQLA